MKIFYFISRSTTDEIRRKLNEEHSKEKDELNKSFSHLNALMDATLAALAKNPDAEVAPIKEHGPYERKNREGPE